jgi:CTP:molybdopterin cytidylyltransferase MocA
MERENKLLLPFKELPLIRYVAMQMLASDLDEVVVITGYQDHIIRKALEGLDVQFQHNPGFYSGMTSSIQTAVAGCPEHIKGLAVCLGDMPFLKPMHYNALLKKFHAEKISEKTPIIRPVTKDLKGHPVLFDRTFFPAIKKCKEVEGCSPVLRENARHLLDYPLANDAYYLDIDTPVQYYKLRE